LREDSVN